MPGSNTRPNKRCPKYLLTEKTTPLDDEVPVLSIVCGATEATVSVS